MSGQHDNRKYGYKEEEMFRLMRIKGWTELIAIMLWLVLTAVSVLFNLRPVEIGCMLTTSIIGWILIDFILNGQYGD